MTAPRGQIDLYSLIPQSLIRFPVPEGVPCLARVRLATFHFDHFAVRDDDQCDCSEGSDYSSTTIDAQNIDLA